MAAPAVIPDAGIYGAETAQANNAYNNAVAQATAQRNALYGQYGLNAQGSVDPNNPTGQYQQMLGQQADAFHQDDEDAAGRNLRGGLAHQAESHDRRDANAQDFQFQNQVAGVGSDYQNTLQDALMGKNNAITGAYNDAMAKALQDQIDAMSSGDYTAPGTGDSNPGGTAGDGSDKSAPPTGRKQSHHAQHQAQQHHNRHHQRPHRPRHSGGGGGGRPARGL